MADRPNVVFIVSDTFRRDHLGAYGNTWIRTPYLDKLARDSVVFDHHVNKADTVLEQVRPVPEPLRRLCLELGVDGPDQLFVVSGLIGPDGVSGENPSHLMPPGVVPALPSKPSSGTCCRLIPSKITPRNCCLRKAWLR